MSVQHGGYTHADGPNGSYRDPKCPSCQIEALRTAAQEAAAALADQGYRLHEYRKRCGCLSMAGVCHRCAQTLPIEERGHAALASLAKLGISP